MAKTKKRVVSKVKTKKMPARKPANKGKAKRKASAKGVSLNSLKTLLAQMEKAPAQAIAGAKTLLKNPNKQAQQLLANYKKQAKSIAVQWNAAQKKLLAAEAKLAKQATATSQAALKNAQKVYNDVMKKAEQLNEEYDIANTVSHQVKQLSAKFDYLAKEVLKAANSWMAPNPPKAAKKAVTLKKQAPKKPTAKAAKPAAATVAPKAPLYKAPPMATKPIVPTVPGQLNRPPMGTAPRNPFSSTPITPQNIAQKPLTGGTVSGNPKQDTPHKPFNFKDDDF